MLLREGDLIKLAKPMRQFDHQGTLFKIISLSTNGIMTIENPTLGGGVMDYSAFAQFFEKWDSPEITDDDLEPPKRAWSDWKLGDDIDSSYSSFMFKENGKRLVAKYIYGGVQASASCHPNDTFDLAKGMRLAVARVKAKNALREAEAIKLRM